MSEQNSNNTNQTTTATSLTYDNCINYIVQCKQEGKGSRKIAKELGLGSKSTVNHWYAKYLKEGNTLDDTQEGPRVLLLDIETSPVLASVWRLFKENIGLNQINLDWHLLSYSAKWLGSEEVFYNDQRYQEDITNDTNLLLDLWALLDEADIVITQNGKKFDIPKIKSRMIINGLKPFSPVKHIDTLIIAKSTFGFTSNKLEYMTDALCSDTKKSKHSKFPGFELWKECLNGNMEAWEEMEVYNKDDVISLEELYKKLSPWSDRLPNFSLYTKEDKFMCNCGSHNIVTNGYVYTDVSKFQGYVCQDCGKSYRGRKNLLSKEKRDNLLTNSKEY